MWAQWAKWAKWAQCSVPPTFDPQRGNGLRTIQEAATTSVAHLGKLLLSQPCCCCCCCSYCFQSFIARSCCHCCCCCDSLPSSVQIFVMAAVTACSLSKSTALFVAASSFSSSKQPVSRPFVVAVKTSSSFSLQERRLCRFSSSSSSQGFVVPSVSSSLNHSCLSRKKPHLRGFFFWWFLVCCIYL